MVSSMRVIILVLYAAGLFFVELFVPSYGPLVCGWLPSAFHHESEIIQICLMQRSVFHVLGDLTCRSAGGVVTRNFKAGGHARDASTGNGTGPGR